MKIASILENQKIEKRISITPEIAKKYILMGFDVFLTKITASTWEFLMKNLKNCRCQIFR